MFQPYSVKFTSGLRTEIAALNADNPQYLDIAQDVVFTKQGSVKGRPGAQSQAAGNVQTYSGAFPSTAVNTSLATATSGLLPAGLSKVPGQVRGDTAFLGYQSKGFVLGDEGWVDTGPYWSTRKTKSADIAPGTYSASAGLVTIVNSPVPVGRRMTGYLGAVGTASGFSWIDEHGRPAGVTTKSANVDAGSPLSSWVVFDGTDDRIFYIKNSGPATTGTLFVNYVTSFPATAETSVQTGLFYTGFPSGRAGGGATGPQTMCAVRGDGTGFSYVAYIPAGGLTVKLIRVNATGNITHTFTTVNQPIQPTSCSVAYDPGTNKVLLTWTAGAANGLSTKILTGGSGGFADQAIDANIGVTAFSLGFGHVTGVVNGAAYIAINGSLLGGFQYDLLLFSRSLTTTAVVTLTPTLFSTRDVTSNTLPTAFFRPLFPPTKFAGRVVIGVQRIVNTGPFISFGSTSAPPLSLNSATWAVLDITELAANGSGTIAPRGIVAWDSAGGETMFGSAYVDSSTGALRFGVLEGRQFDTNGISAWSAIRVEIAPAAATAKTMDGQTLLSGAAPYVLSGSRTAEAGWLERPIIMSVTAPNAGGLLTNPGSYTFQAFYVYTNAAGRLVRSPVALPVTASTTATNKQFTVVVTVPMLQNPVGFSPSSPPVLELYSTVANPSASANLFLVGSAALYGSVSPTITFTDVGHGRDTDTTARVLYTSGNIVDDEAPPAGDRGIAVSGLRVWVADQHHLYASKTSKATIAPAWSTVGFLTLDVPTALGEVNGLAAMDDKVIAVCTGGLLVVSGPGYDDLGNGAGFQHEVLVAAGGASNVRGVCETPQGVVYVGAAGELYTVSRGLQVQCISRPARNFQSGTSSADVVIVYPASGTNTMIFSGGFSGGDSQQVFVDTETGQWGTWTYENGTLGYQAEINGALWSQLVAGDPDIVVSFDTTTGTDTSGPVTMFIRTGLLKPADGQTPVAHGWGRIRSVSILETFPSTYSLSVSLNQQTGAILCSKTVSRTALGATNNWPDNHQEITMTRQRCDFAIATITGTPAIAEWAELDVWADTTAGRAPSRNRV